MDTIKEQPEGERDNPVVCAECGWSKKYCDCPEFIPEAGIPTLVASDFDEDTPIHIKNH